MTDNPMIMLRHPLGTSQHTGIMMGGSKVLLTV